MGEAIILKRFYKPFFIFLLHSRLTSPLDLYSTLRHILQTFSPSDRRQGQSEGQGRGQSLFRPVLPLERSCHELNYY